MNANMNAEPTSRNEQANTRAPSGEDLSEMARRPIESLTSSRCDDKHLTGEWLNR